MGNQFFRPAAKLQRWLLLQSLLQRRLGKFSQFRQLLLRLLALSEFTLLQLGNQAGDALALRPFDQAFKNVVQKSNRLIASSRQQARGPVGPRPIAACQVGEQVIQFSGG